MSEADKMFEELGYIKDIEVDYGLIRYNKDDNSYIRFIIDEESVETNTIIDNQVYVLSVDMELLQVINLKCKELRVVE